MSQNWHDWVEGHYTSFQENLRIEQGEYDPDYGPDYVQPTMTCDTCFALVPGDAWQNREHLRGHALWHNPDEVIPE